MSKAMIRGGAFGLVVALICGRNHSAIAATSSRTGDVAAARKFIKDSLTNSGRDDVEFHWQDFSEPDKPAESSAPLQDVRITSTTVTFVTDPAFEWQFPLNSLKLKVGEDFVGGQVTLQIVNKPSRAIPAGLRGDHWIRLGSYSGETANKIVADFALLSGAARQSGKSR